jgi:hypothetical protein
MKLPAVQKAIVPRTKITDYLLCLTHTNWQSKARFFLNQGFCIEYWQELAEALKDLAQRNEVINVEKTPLVCVMLLMVKLTRLINVILLFERFGLLNMSKQFLFL